MTNLLPNHHQQPPNMAKRPVIQREQSNKRRKHQPLGQVEELTKQSNAGEQHGHYGDHQQGFAVGESGAHEDVVKVVTVWLHYRLPFAGAAYHDGDHVHQGNGNNPQGGYRAHGHFAGLGGVYQQPHHGKADEHRARIAHENAVAEGGNAQVSHQVRHQRAAYTNRQRQLSHQTGGRAEQQRQGAQRHQRQAASQAVDAIYHVKGVGGTNHRSNRHQGPKNTELNRAKTQQITKGYQRGTRAKRQHRAQKNLHTQAEFRRKVPS